MKKNFIVVSSKLTAKNFFSKGRRTFCDCNHVTGRRLRPQNTTDKTIYVCSKNFEIQILCFVFNVLRLFHKKRSRRLQSGAIFAEPKKILNVDSLFFSTSVTTVRTLLRILAYFFLQMVTFS